MRTTIFRALAAAALLAAGLETRADDTSRTSDEQRRVEKRLAQVEQRLTGAETQGRLGDALRGRARRMLELSRRFLASDNLAAAQVQVEVAERFTAILEGKPTQVTR